MRHTITIPGVSLPDDEFLLAVESVGGKQHVLTNQRTISLSSKSTSDELPHDALNTFEMGGFFSAEWGRIMAVLAGGTGPKTVLRLIPKQGMEYQKIPLRFSIFNQKALLRFLGILLMWVLSDALNVDDAPPVDENGILLPIRHNLDLCIVGHAQYCVDMMDMMPDGVLLLTEHTLWYFEEPGTAPLERNRIHAIIPYAAIVQSIAKRYATTAALEDELLRVLAQAQLSEYKRHPWAQCQEFAYTISMGMGNLTFADASSGKKIRITVMKKDSIETLSHYFEQRG